MEDRRTVLIAFGFASLGWISGCLETVTGGSFSDRMDPAELSARKGELVDVYAGAVDDRNEGVRVREDAIGTFNDESYGEAIEKFDAAIEHFDGARQGFREAASLAYELGEDEAGSICEDAEADAELQIAATRAGLNAAKAADGDGTAADVNEHVEEYQDLLQQAEDVPVEDPQALVEVIESE